MGLIEVSAYTTPHRAAAIHAKLMGKPQRRVIEAPVEEAPPEPKKPRTIFKFVPPQEPTQHNAHVSDWYRHECGRLGKQVSALEFKLGAYNETGGNRVYVADIIAKMCEYYGVSKIDIKSERRTQKIVLPRQKMMWVAMKLTTLSYPQVGLHFGGRDHTTVLHAVRKIDALIAANDPSVADLKGWLE